MIAVVDASVALKWFFNERTDEPRRTDLLAEFERTVARTTKRLSTGTGATDLLAEFERTVARTRRHAL